MYYFKKLDWFLVIAAVSLSLAGLVTIYNIGSPESSVYFKKQLIFLGIGFLLMLGLSFFDYRAFKNYSSVLLILYLLAVVSLALVLFSRSIRGSSSWFRLGPFNFEPVEFAKVVAIIVLAKYFSLRHVEMYRSRHLIVSGLYIGLPAVITALQPDFGSALILICLWLGLIVVSGIRVRHLLILFLILSVAFAAGWFCFLRDYQKQRILTFLNPSHDPFGGGYHISQSLIAVGSGRLIGAESNSQAGLKFLPEQHTDFIFAALAEQRGLVGVAVFLSLFAFLFWRMIKIAAAAPNNFSRLYVVGVAIMIFVQMFINIGMNMALLPVTGLTLPLVSYGGSSLVSTFLALGIVQSVKARS